MWCLWPYAWRYCLKFLNISELKKMEQTCDSGFVLQFLGLVDTRLIMTVSTVCGSLLKLKWTSTASSVIIPIYYCMTTSSVIIPIYHCMTSSSVIIPIYHCMTSSSVIIPIYHCMTSSVIIPIYHCMTSSSVIIPIYHCMTSSSVIIPIYHCIIYDLKKKRRQNAENGTRSCQKWKEKRYCKYMCSIESNLNGRLNTPTLIHPWLFKVSAHARSGPCWATQRTFRERLFKVCAHARSGPCWATQRTFRGKMRGLGAAMGPVTKNSF